MAYAIRLAGNDQQRPSQRDLIAGMGSSRAIGSRSRAGPGDARRVSMFTPGHSDDAFLYENDRLQAKLTLLLLIPAALICCWLIVAAILS